MLRMIQKKPVTALENMEKNVYSYVLERNDLLCLILLITNKVSTFFY